MKTSLLKIVNEIKGMKKIGKLYFPPPGYPILKNNSYLGLRVPGPDQSQEIKQYRDLARKVAIYNNEIPSDSDLQDRGEFHITVINPKEYRNLGKQKQKELLAAAKNLSTDDLTLHGLGSAKSHDDKDIAYFIVVDWPSADNFRDQFGLGKYEYHITLGFRNRDVFPHTAFKKEHKGPKNLKGKESIILPHHNLELYDEVIKLLDIEDGANTKA